MLRIIIEPGKTEKNYWKDLWHFRELFYILSWRDIKVRYRQTVRHGVRAAIHHCSGLAGPGRKHRRAAGADSERLGASAVDSRVAKGHAGTQHAQLDGYPLTLERVWERMGRLSVSTAREGVVLRPRQEQLLKLLGKSGGMTPAELWAALKVSKQGAMDLLRPLVKAGLVKRVGTLKTGRYVLK